MSDQPNEQSLRKLRVCIYGSTDLDRPLADFVRQLTLSVLKKLDVVIVTGGVKRRKWVKRHLQSVDQAAYEGAKQYADDRKDVDLKNCFEAWIPDPDQSRRPEIIRMPEDYKIGRKIMKERSDLGRRLRMIRDVDIVLTVKGKIHTERVLEQALETGTPALPLPFSGGDSKDFWDKKKSQIQSWFPALSVETAGRLEHFRRRVSV